MVIRQSPVDTGAARDDLRQTSDTTLLITT